MGSISVPVWSVIPVAYLAFWGFLQNLDWAREIWGFLFGDARAQLRRDDAEWARRLEEERKRDQARHPAGSERPSPTKKDGPSNYLVLPAERSWNDIKSGGTRSSAGPQPG